MRPRLGQFPGATTTAFQSSAWSPAFGPGGQPSGGPSLGPSGPAPTSVRLYVQSAASLSPLPGAAVAVFGIPVHGDPWPAAEGQTDAEGIFSFEGAGVPNENAYRWRLDVTPGDSGVGFPLVSVEAPAGKESSPVATVCPGNLDPLVCEVADKQQTFAATFSLQLDRWSGNRDFALRMGHAEVRNARVVDPRMEPYFNHKSYAVADLGIPPADWPELVRNEAQMRSILDQIPWPSFKGPAEKLGEYFRSCSEAVPVTDGKDGRPLAPKNFRLYAPTWSDYFPRSDAQIKRDIAARWLLNMKTVFRCVHHKVKKKAREVERSAKMHQGLAFATILVFSPMLGPSATGVFATELYSYLRTDYDITVPDEIQDALVYSGVTSGTDPGASGVIAGVLAVAISYALADMDISPVARAIAENAVPDIAGLIVEEAISGSGVTGGVEATGAAYTVDPGVVAGSAVLAFAVGALAASVRAQGVKRVVDFQRMMLGFNDLQAEVIPFYVWCMRVLGLDKMLAQIGQEAGLDMDADRDIIEPLVRHAEEQGVEVPGEALAPMESSRTTPEASTETGKVLAVGGLSLAAVAALAMTGILGS